MENNQIKLLNQLFKKLDNQIPTKKDVSLSLQRAKIITEKGNFTKQYSSLENIMNIFIILM